MKKRYFYIVIGITVLCSVFFVYRHPILLKWMTGSARIVSLPLQASVYADGKLDKRIKVFHSNTYWDGSKADYYVLYLLSPYSFRTKHIISLNIQDKYVGIPAATNKTAFDLVFGILFQSETGAQWSDFRDDMKGYGFDPQMHISGKAISFSIPSKEKPEPSLIRIAFSE